VFDVEDIVAGNNGAALGLVRSEIHFADPRLDYGAGTHRTRLERHEHITVIQTPVADLTAGFVDRYDFGMHKTVGLCQLQIVSAHQDFVITDDNTAYRTFLEFVGFARFLERFSHKTPGVIIRHTDGSSPLVC